MPDSIRRRANYFLCLVIGAWFEGLGLALRLALRNDPHNQGLYIVSYLFVVLSVSRCANRLASVAAQSARS